MALSGSAQITAFNPTANHTEPQHGVGEIVRDGDRSFKYVKFDNGTDDVAAAAGRLCYWKSFGSGTVTSDVSSAASSVNSGAGFFINILTDGNFGWIQTWGKSVTNARLAGLAWGAGDSVVASSQPDGTVGRVAQGTAPTHQVLGILATRLSATEGAVYITIDRG